MKLSRRSKRIFEPPAILLTDLAFNLVIFFVVCASMEPASGRKQPIPNSSKDQKATTQAAQNIEVVLAYDTVTVNGAIVPLVDLASRLRPLLADKKTEQERMVVVKSAKNALYRDWIRVTTMIEEANGVVALQLEESAEVVVQ